MNLPPITIEELHAELQLAQETTQAVSRLFSAIADHNNAIGHVTANAVASGDLAVIQNLRGVLILLTDSLQQLDQPDPPARPKLVS